MDSTGIDDNESAVDEGAFWHTNMDLYYGYMPGEIVEVEHEPGKYWMARIQYCYKHLILLEWVGKYGEFWVDTSTSNAATSLSNTLVESSVPKRLFPLGHHIQPQMKSQFILEKPTRILVAPSLYNPACDPYANIKNVDDLLAHDDEEDKNKDDTLINNSGNKNLELALVCKKKIEYRQEDVDELEAALQNLNKIVYLESATEVPPNPIIRLGDAFKEMDRRKLAISKVNDRNHGQSSTKDSGVGSETCSVPTSTSPDRSGLETTSDSSSVEATIKPSSGVTKKAPVENLDEKIHNNRVMELCNELQRTAIDFGRYMGIDQTHTDFTDEWFLTKPKQFFDMGGVNHEKLFVPGTLLEVCHTLQNSEGDPDVYYWFAFVVKNTGGRLTLRWFLCDEPKFKQGRLELKSSRSLFVNEESDSADDQSGNTEKSPERPGSASNPTTDGIPAKSLTFSLHFCHPRIHNIRYAHINSMLQDTSIYQLPQVITDHVEVRISNLNVKKYRDIRGENLAHIYDTRRMNLDKDRPLIDHILNVARHKAPDYLDIVFSGQDSKVAREILVSCPKLTKLLRARIVRELDPGVFEIHSYQMQEDDELIKFIYPFDSSYAVLPLDWAINNEDCLSVDPSRNPTPDQSKQNTSNNDKVASYRNGQTSSSDTRVNKRTGSGDKTTTDEVNSGACLRFIRKALPKQGAPFRNVPQKIWEALHVGIYPGFNGYDPKYWSQALQDQERRTQTFHCCIDFEQKQAVESRFKVMDQLEITHPFSDSTICLGRIRKVVFPLLWIQLSTDCFTMIPFNSTDIYPLGWCKANNHKLVSMLPPRKRFSDQVPQGNSKKRKKVKTADPKDGEYENEKFNLGEIYDRQLDFDYILQEKNNYIKIYFNHKCFTGPSLSKSKICSLPQYVGPGPMHLVLEEVVTRIISVAYVPPRLLNELSSKSFEELLVSRHLTNTKNHTFKAKYQKRVHRERVPVCLSPKDIAQYCELICEHIKCCYNLFGPTLFDGDDCPSHCRSLTKSNKFMKRATYYREKARQGDYLSSEPIVQSDSKQAASPTTPEDEPKASDSRCNGRRSSDSTNSSAASRLEQVQSRASSSSGEADVATNDLRESLKVVMEENEIDRNHIPESEKHDEFIWNNQKVTPEIVISKEVEIDPKDMAHGTFLSIGDGGENVIYPEDWHVDDVARWLGIYELEMFQSSIKAEGIDGQALLLLDQDSIREHFQNDPMIRYTSDEIDRLWKFVAMIQSNQPKSGPTSDHRTEACRIRKLQN